MFRILCLDGGGARGYFTAYILKRIEEDFNIKINEYFDLIAGTSTGAIVAASISLGIDTSEILDLYKYENENIFRNNGFNKGMLASIYTNTYLEALLRKKVQARSFKDLKTNTMIMSTQIEDRSPKIFKSWEENRNIDLVQAVLSSSAAPIFFDPYKINNKLYSDGCLWANNPSLVALSEALSNKTFNQDLKNVKLLSIGTGKNIKPYDYSEIKKWGFLSWSKDLVEIMLNSSVAGDDMAVSKMLDEAYLRIDYHLTEDTQINVVPKYVLDHAEDIYLEHKSDIAKFIMINRKENSENTVNKYEKEKEYNVVQKIIKKIFRI